MRSPTLRLLPGGRAHSPTPGDGGGRRGHAPRPSGESAATARLLPVDAGCNADWDEFLIRCQDAWHWRDPESLARVARLLTQLERRTTEEWSS